jgi:hypothetical protein
MAKKMPSKKRENQLRQFLNANNMNQTINKRRTIEFKRFCTSNQIDNKPISEIEASIQGGSGGFFSRHVV